MISMIQTLNSIVNFVNLYSINIIEQCNINMMLDNVIEEGSMYIMCEFVKCLKECEVLYFGCLSY